MNASHQDDIKCCIVIPYKDNSHILARCLASVLSNVPATTLIVVVDDGSEISGKADRNLTQFLGDRRLILLQHSENLGAGSARNTGIQWCYEQGIAIAILLDSDCSVATGFVETHCHLHSQYPEVAVFGGAVHGIGDGIWATLDNLMSWFTSIPNAPLREVDGLYHIPTTNMSLKLNALFPEIPLFDAHLRTGEDVRLVQRLRRNGYKLMFSPQPEISHYDRESFADFLQHQYRWGLHTFALRFPSLQDHKLARFLLIILFVLLLPFFAIAASIITIAPWLRQSLKYWWYFPMILCVYLYKGFAIVVGTYNPQLATNPNKL
jgi:GT2 family glycosyltransferase